MLHFGRLNVRGKYTTNGMTLNNIDVQRDLGVQVQSILKMAAQVDKVLKKAYGTVAFIARGIEVMM